MKKSTAPTGENAVYVPPFITAPTKFDPLGDDFEEWLTSAELYMKIVAALYQMIQTRQSCCRCSINQRCGSYVLGRKKPARIFRTFPSKR